jgi:hypothetical protein
MPQDFSKYMKFDYPQQTSVVNIHKKDINEFIGFLHDVQLDYIDEAVSKSDLSEANVIIKHIMGLPNGLH